MILTAPKVLPFRPSSAVIDNGAVVCSRGSIVAVGPSAKLLPRYPGHRIHCFGDAVLMPGLINIHTHLELPPLLNKINSRKYGDWVLSLLDAEKTLTRNNYAAATILNIGTLIETGTTAVGEICSHGISLKLLAESGLRSQVYQEIISMNPGRKPSALHSSLPRNSDLIRFGLSPHSPHTVSEAVLRSILSSAARRHLRLSMHVAETRAEGRLLRREKSALDALYETVGWAREWAPEAPSSIALLDRIGILGPNLLIVHAVDVGSSDIKKIKLTGTAVAHCPRSNHTLRVGTMPLKKMLASGIHVGLGTDSLASVATLSLWDEMRFAYKVHRESGVTPKDLFSMATRGGAMALGMELKIGSLEKGKKADIIAVSLPRKNTGNIYSDLLRETECSIMTMVEGKILHNADDHKVA